MGAWVPVLSFSSILPHTHFILLFSVFIEACFTSEQSLTYFHLNTTYFLTFHIFFI
jgi:hypothetical protein